jgi:hypothetical protein
MEAAVKPLLQASATDQWRYVLNVLYLNGSVLCVSEDVGLPVLVSVEGDPDEVEESSDLLQAKFKTEISSIVNRGLQSFLPTIINALKEMNAKSPPGTTPEAMFQAGLVGKITDFLESHSSEISQLLVQGGFRFADVIVASTFESLVRLRRGHIQTTLEESVYEEMVDGLRKLGIIESKLQISLCPDCANYEASLSRSLRHADTCPRCSSEWSTATVYTFGPQYEQVKLKNNDLPLFVSAYLRYKVNSEAPFGSLNVRPLVEISSTKGHHFEVDVYLPEFQLGIECKIFENSFAPLTKSRLGSIAGDLTEQIKKYYSIGLKKVALITNLPSDSSEKVKAIVSKKLRKGMPDFEMVPGDVESLLEWLDTLAHAIAEKVNKDFERSITRVSKAETVPPQVIQVAPPQMPKVKEPIPAH